MSYTPINWQTGQTITAEKLNKMDNGWSVTEGIATLFDGSVTTAENNNHYEGELNPTVSIAADTAIITFNGTEYECPNLGDTGNPEYGAVYGDTMDFSTFPFNIYENSTGNVIVTTQTAGTYTVKIEADRGTVETSEQFSKAVNNCVSPSATAVLCVAGVTNRADVDSNTNLLYFHTEYLGTFIITTIGNPCSILPENAQVRAGFNRDNGIFYVEIT